MSKKKQHVESTLDDFLHEEGILVAGKAKAGAITRCCSFSYCPTDDGDELYPNGIFVFNITKMLDYIHQNPGNFAIEEVAVNDLPAGSYNFNEPHLQTVDVEKPIILAEIAPGRYNVIDGNHRLEKARREGKERIRAYRLGPEVHMRFLTTEEGYGGYIEYWNSKLK